MLEIVPYDPQWPDVFRSEIMLIKQALGENFLVAHHIGSTSVPGLAAKPKIDITATVKNGKLSIQQLEEAGFTHKGEWAIPFKFGFTKRGVHNINLHIFEQDHPDIEAHILFRDYLIHHPKTRVAYEKLKQELLLDPSAQERSNTMLFYYTLRKGNFIRDVLKRTGFNKIRMSKCTDDMEWNTAKHLQDTYFSDLKGIRDSYMWTCSHSDHIHLVLYQGVDIIGYAHVQLLAEFKAALRVMVIDEKQRNQTIGSIFLRLIEKWLRSFEIKNIHVRCEQNILPFYLKNGYTKIQYKNAYMKEKYRDLDKILLNN